MIKAGPIFVTKSDSVIVELSTAETTMTARSLNGRENARDIHENRYSHPKL